MKRVEGDMLVVGTQRLSTWEIASRNQRRAAKFTPTAAVKPGVYRFSSHADADQWMLNQQITASLKKRT